MIILPQILEIRLSNFVYIFKDLTAYYLYNIHNRIHGFVFIICAIDLIIDFTMIK